MKTSRLLCVVLFLFFAHSNTHAQKNKIKSIIEKYFHAIGGEERAKQIQSFSSEAVGNLNDTQIILKQKMMLPNMYFTSMELGGKLISQSTFDGQQGIILQQSDEIPFSKEELKRHKKNRSIFPEFDYLKTAKYIGIEKVEQSDCHVLKIDNTKVYYSVDSGLKRKGVSIQEKDGTTFLQQLFFGNYVEIEGLLFPTNLLMVAGKNKIDFQTKSILINRDVSKEDFLIKN